MESRYQEDLTDWKQQASEAVTALANLRGQPGAPPDIDQALAMLEQGRTKDAKAIFQTIAERKEADIQEAAAAYRHIGALAFLDDTQKALAAYRSATDLDPANVQGWNQLGHLFFRVGKLDEAEAAYHKVKDFGEAKHDQALIGVASGNLGLIYRIRGDLEQAEAMYRKALSINEALGSKEGMAYAYNNLGNVYRTRGDLEQAEAMYKKSLVLFQDIGAAPQVERVQRLLGGLRQSD
jgi:tetratricopeptide (TPR) repeat protein